MTARTMFAALLLAMLPMVVCGQNSASGDEVPPQLRPPGKTKPVLHAHAKGDQVYICKQEGGQYSWTLKAPDAQLFNESGKAIGHHSAGPTWQLNDGSAVIGKVAARFDPPDKDAIPWLLLTATEHSGSGLMNSVTHIQRLNTKRGKAPAAGCDASHAGDERRVPYTADYFFYADQQGQ
ncbi:MAG TPA: DUF3455 domain-containing protein [Terriglobales bacterium]|nr:DUF3455 domain-containing protein [Terriglobales bacterium]